MRTQYNDEKELEVLLYLEKQLILIPESNLKNVQGSI